MGLAERMTDPDRHAVLDGSGLVPTRHPPGKHWLVHSFTITRMWNGTWPSIRSQLAARETPVILPNYRLDKLPEEDQAFIRAHYVSLASDFKVLGRVATGGQTDWEALAEGRYELRLLQAPPDATVVVDGVAAAPGVLPLGRGPHRFQYPGGSALQIVWLGPGLKAMPALPDTPEPLFLNWY
jgi:hypothetical protein